MILKKHLYRCFLFKLNLSIFDVIIRQNKYIQQVKQILAYFYYMNNISKENFSKMLKSEGYQIFLFSCPAIIPFNIFFSHSWFVCVRNKKVSRWEVLFHRNKKNKIIGRHLHLNSLDPFVGAGMTPFFFDKLLWKPKLIKCIEGGENSLANKMCDFIENSSNNYKHKDKYWAIGPNCNTYINWVLNEFPEFDIKLSIRFIGKKI